MRLASDRAAFFAAGADAFLTEPIRTGTLRDALDEVALSLDAPVAAIAAADLPGSSVDDEGSVPRLAHGLKGSSAALGATGLAEVCHSLETADPAGPAVADALAVLDRERARVRAAVTALVAAGGPGDRDGAGEPPTIEP